MRNTPLPVRERLARAVVVVAALAGALGCAELPTLGVCGNGIVDENEDCDGKAGLSNGGTCGAPNEAKACRLVCDVTDASKTCPPDHFCSGTDGVCRKPNGRFSELASIDFDADRIAMGDFDGDGIADVFASSGQSAGAIQARVAFLAPDGALSELLPVPPVRFAAGAPLTDAKVPDLVGFLPNDAARTGMLVLHGDQRRALAPGSFSSFPFPDSSVKFLPLYAEAFGVLLALRGQDILGYSIDYGGKPKGLGTLPQKPHLDYGRVGYLGDLGSAAAGFRLAIAYAHHVEVYSFDDSSMMHGGLAVTVQLPDPTATVTDYFFTYFDGDYDQDLVIVTDCGSPTGACTGERVFVAYGTVDGSSLGPSSGAAGSASVVAEDLQFFAGIIEGAPLPKVIGARNLSGGGTGDVIASDGIYQPDGMGSWNNVVPFTPLTASEVALADFNGDGRVDLLLASQDQPQLEYLLNAGGNAFNPALIPLAGQASNLVVGDFDGDLYADVAFAEKIDPSDGRVGFVFGGQGARPTGPLEVGPFAAVSQLVPSPNILEAKIPTSRTDLLTVTGTGDSARIAVFPGSADRELYSPWFFVRPHKKDPDTPSSAAIGDFTGKGPELAAITGGAEYLLWSLDSSGGTLSQVQTPVKLPDAIDGSRASLVRVAGLDGAPDLLAILSINADYSHPHGALTVPSTSSGKFSFGAGPIFFDPPPLVLDGPQTMIPLGGNVSLSFAVPRVPSCSANLDDDAGGADLAFVGAGLHGNELLVAWRDGGALSTPVPIDIGKPLAPDDIACIRTATGTGIAVLTGGDVRLVRCGGDAGRTCADGGIVARPGGGLVYNKMPGGTLMPNGSTTPALAVGDVTGDGIDDIVVIGFDQGIQIFAAQPTIP